MTDIRGDEPTPEEEDRLPWLEAVDEDDERDGPSPMKLFVAVLIGLVAIGFIVSALYWIGNRNQQEGPPELITADQGDYKTKPANPGGMQVQGTGTTSLAASEGAEPKGQLNVNAVPEAPVAKAPKQPAPAPAKPEKATKMAAAKEAAPKHEAAAAPAPVAGGAAFQLGAFSSESAANRAWKALAARFKYLQPLSHSVTPVTVSGRTLYRLRASGANAGDVCGRLRVAGETCVSVS